MDLPIAEYSWGRSDFCIAEKSYFSIKTYMDDMENGFRGFPLGERSVSLAGSG